MNVNYITSLANAVGALLSLKLSKKTRLNSLLRDRGRVSRASVDAYHCRIDNPFVS